MIFDVNLGFDTDAKAKLVFNYLTAHFLSITLSLNNANDGSSGIVSAKSVGDVSESFTIPEWMQKGSYALYRGSKYGVKYAELTKSLRYAKSLFFVAEGSTNPVIN